MHGHGIFNWWGFSPPVDLLSYVDGEDVTGATVQVMVIGAGDPRHLLVTLARKHRRRLRVYLLEAQVEVYARMLLLMGISLQQDLGLRERAGLLLDLWGNLYLRPTSRDYLDHAARRLSVAVTDAAQYPALLGLISARKLKYRERDAIDAVCRTWYKLSPDQYDIALCWDVRLRQMLGTRYDNRQAEAEWAWHMRLAHRIQHLQVGPPGRKAGGGVAPGDGGAREDGHVGAGWGLEYLVWRATGQAFTVATDAASHLPNTSLASVATLTEGTRRHRRVGYWGDVLTGPFPALALASTDPRVSKTSNGRSKYSGSEVAQWNLENLLHQLWAHHHYVEEEQQLVEASVEKLVEGKAKETADERDEEKVVKAQGGLDHKSLMENKVEKEREEKVKMRVDQVEVKTEEVEKQLEGKVEKHMEEKVKKLGIHGEQNMNMEVTHTQTKGKREVMVRQQINREKGKEEANVAQRWKTNPETKERLETENDEEKRETKTKNEKNIDEGDKFMSNNKSDNSNKDNKNKNYELLTSNTQRNMNTMCESATDGAVSTVSHGVGKRCNTQCLATISTESQDQSEIDTQNSRSNTKDNVPSQWPGNKHEVGERGASGDWLRLDGVEVVLVSPSHLKDLTSLREVEGGLDLVYLSAAMAHLLTPTLLHVHLRPHTRLILETAQMFPELTDDQVREYESRVTSSAAATGWVRTGPDPLCHLLFYRR